MTRQRSAEDWLALMAGPDAGHRRGAFEAWHRDPANAAAYAALEKDLAAARNVSAERIAGLAKIHDGARRAQQQQWAMAAAILLAVAGGITWFALRPGADAPEIAAAGTAREQRLADGTRVTLLDGATIAVNFSPRERLVTLSGGRARFTVAKDARRPFRAIAGSSVTTALGTVFEIDLRGAAPRIRLIEGAIDVATRAAEPRVLRLAPGESAEVGADGPRRVPAMTSPVAATMLDADRLPLGAIVDRANRVNARKIALADPALAALRVTGRFEIGDGDRLARKLAAALGLAVEARADGLLLTQPKK